MAFPTETIAVIIKLFSNRVFFTEITSRDRVVNYYCILTAHLIPVVKEPATDERNSKCSKIIRRNNLMRIPRDAIRIRLGLSHNNESLEIAAIERQIIAKPGRRHFGKA